MSINLHQNPWEIESEDNRSADTLRTFIIFCEDEHHEPLYFQSFEKYHQDLKVNAIPNQRSKKLNINATLYTCREQGLIEFKDANYRIIPGTTENIWCVYDRDSKNEILADNPPADNLDFDTSIMLAQNAGIKVAWSNDLFELWLLLHFEDVPTGRPLHRNYVYERLTDVFKNQVPRNDELDIITAHEKFSYKENMKRRERFINQVLKLLPEKLSRAIERADELEAAFGSEIPYHEKNPCTMVHHLVRQLRGN